MRTIIDYLVAHSRTAPLDTVFTFLEDGGDIFELNYLGLHDNAYSISRHLLERFRPGDTVVLLIPPGLGYLKAFFGCMYAGLVAVPLYPPKKGKHSQRVTDVIENCDAKLILTTDELKSFLSDEFAPLPVFGISECLKYPKSEIDFVSSVSSSALAYLQYTSGSTGTPKGVMITHGNILENLKSLQEATNCSSEDVFCNWLPLFHDLGLVNTILLPIYLGAHSVLMSPGKFIRRPLSWLETIGSYKATICGAPNFAYDYCVSRIRDLKDLNLDLSSWRVAFNAAEPIDPDTIIRFSDYFGKFGFSSTAMYPSYGMAEATVFIAGGKPGEIYIESFDKAGLQLGNVYQSRDSNAIRLVACGEVQANHHLAIVDPQTCDILEIGKVGEIWFAGPSVARGYWQDGAGTSQTFRATIPRDNNHYLRTGDLGFIFNDYLFVTGRIKDVIIVRGRNYYPQDLEKTVLDSCSGLRRGGVVAMEDHGSIMIAAEVETRRLKEFDFGSAARLIRAEIFDEFDVLVSGLFFVRAGSLPKTSSGKTQRSETKRLIAAKGLELLSGSNSVTSVAEYEPPVSQVELYLTRLWEEFFQQKVGRRDNFFQLGGSSMTALHFVHRINTDFSLALPLKILFQCDELWSLAELIEGEILNGSKSSGITRKNNLTVSPNQESLWFIDQLENGSSQYNLVSMQNIKGHLNIRALQHALTMLVERHQILRTCYVKRDGVVCAKVLDSWVIDLSVLEIRFEDLEAKTRCQVETPFRLENDLMIRCQLLVTAPNTFHLILCCHHIAVDGFSLSIIERELSELYQLQIDSDSIQLCDVAVQFNDYVSAVRSREFDRELVRDYWRNQLSNAPVLHGLLTDFTRPARQSYSGSSIGKKLDVALMNSLNGLAKEQKVSLYVLLQTSFSCLLFKYSGQQDVVIGSPFLNREIPESRNIIGFIANPLVLRNKIEGQSSFDVQLRNNKAVIHSAISHNDISFYELIDLLSPERSLSYHPLFQIMFTFNEWEMPSMTFSEAAVERVNVPRRYSRFDLTLEIVKDKECFTAVWEYATDLFRKETIEKLHNNFVCLLESILRSPGQKIDELNLISQEEQSKILAGGINIGEEISYGTIHSCFEKRVESDSRAIAVYFGQDSVTFESLNERANRIANYLVSLGVGSGDLIALFMERSIDMVVALLAILKSGSAYVPLDPSYPLERTNYMLRDSCAKFVICKSNTAPILQVPLSCKILNLDEVNCQNFPISNLISNAIPSTSLAYVIYTSGSTGLPKGVQVSHSNVLNFFSGLDKEFSFVERQNYWLAITSICFDISLLELFWTLTRGDYIRIQPDKPSRLFEPVAKPMEFGLFYFSSNAENKLNKFELLIEGARFADQQGLSSVWLPERHFHEFGGQFANPAVAAAAVAATTEHIRIRSGSVVLPLHDPIRVAEEWSMVDNLSGGRVELSIAPGWQPNDFILSPLDFNNRHDVMKEKLNVLKHLWQGHSINRVNGRSQERSVRIYPSPIQETLPVWITAANNIETFKYAGSIGANVLTHLLGQTQNELREKILAYKSALQDHGFDPVTKSVCLMLHTFMNEDIEFVRGKVELPFKKYIADSISLIHPSIDLQTLTADDYNELIEHAYNRYFDEAGLFGTLSQCQEKINGFQSVGITEIACLIDFGIENKVVLEGLKNIAELQELGRKKWYQRLLLAKRFDNNWQPENLLLENRITHLQCTPSFARELSDDSLNHLSVLLVGGEALTEDLSNRLSTFPNLSVFNMYGPTETTVWVSVNRQESGQPIRLARPMLNSQFLVLDAHMKLTPIGVAGELHVAGLSVAQGYLNRPELNAQKFVSNPFWHQSDERFMRMYKTGDLVRWVFGVNGDLELQYLGRVDQQVKVNGARIELGEIENVLNLSPHVSQSVVINIDGKLRAYIVGAKEYEIQIRQFMSQFLPDYMCPVEFVFLDELPLTPNGKIDRNTLAVRSVLLLPPSGREPQTGIELLIYEVWQRNLPIKEFSAECEFFSLGGNSLLAVKVISEINMSLDDAILEVRDLFIAQSVASLGQIIEEKLTLKNNLTIFENEKNLEESQW